MSSGYINFLNSVANTIYYYPIIIGLPIGIIGDVFSFYIYTRPNLNKKTNTGFLYACLCIANLIFMLYFVFVFRSPGLFGYTVSLPCGLLQYLLRVIFCFVPWMQVIISFDRFIAVIYPLKKNVITQKWILSVIIVVTVALIAVANMSNLLQYPNANGRCTSTIDVQIAGNIIAILSRAYVPFSIILIMDLIVFNRLRQSKRRVAVTQLGQRKQSHQISNKEYSFIVSTIIIDLMFVLFYTPVAVYITIAVVNVYITWDQLTTTAINVFYSVALLLAFYYSVWLIFIFFILNRYFRNEAIAILRLNRFFPDLNQTLMETGSIINMPRTMN